jgi:hypothetical protein
MITNRGTKLYMDKEGLILLHKIFLKKGLINKGQLECVEDKYGKFSEWDVTFYSNRIINFLNTEIISDLPWKVSEVIMLNSKKKLTRKERMEKLHKDCIGKGFQW